ncbi:AraC family transcriptional regulator [Xanthomonas euvesicatoria]|uniref:AraC family transcriptional regulator n=1 Tax=Xanthomonas euvesicatoria TaxID=456327 RepID=UPI0030C7DA04
MSASVFPASLPSRAISYREGLGTTAHVIQARRLLSTKIETDSPTLIVVRSGTKQLRWPGGKHTLQAGGMIAVDGNQSFDVINTPDKRSGLYEADWLVCSNEVINEFALRAKGRRIVDARAIDRCPTAMLQSYEHARSGLDPSVPLEVAKSRFTEMLEWLDHFGGYFAVGSQKRVSAQIRRLLARNMAADLTAPDAAKRLGLSEATLRRRLVEEDTQFQRLIIDARMSHALTLLQVTDLSVTAVASEVGYDSPSRFSSRFKERFGCSPSDIRPPAAATNSVQVPDVVTVGARSKEIASNPPLVRKQ